MALLIDSSVFITMERRGQRLSALARVVPGEPLALATITAAELGLGKFTCVSGRSRKGGARPGGVWGVPKTIKNFLIPTELLVGVHRAGSPAHRFRREAFVEAILETIPVLPFDLRIARIYARLSAQLAAAGQPVGAHDLLIGATALAHGCPVLTENVRDFHRVPGLVVQRPNW
ncbi:MAG: PIN domain-containing protein [Chloroflexi bacterium]|nr:PIN domain-containing protein [Chloroflexota bacterium]